MSDIATENYKKNVAKLIDGWAAKIAKIGEELAKVQADLDKLEANKSPSKDEQDAIAALKKRRQACRDHAESETQNLRLNLIVLQPADNADTKELAKLPDWMEKLIKAKGVPLGKGVSIRPSIGFDFKKKKLTSFGVTITFP